MNLNKILADLRQEREQIDEAIVSLERLAAGPPNSRERERETGLCHEISRGRLIAPCPGSRTGLLS
jgi:hypothetical protein